MWICWYIWFLIASPHSAQYWEYVLKEEECHCVDFRYDHLFRVALAIRSYLVKYVYFVCGWCGKHSPIHMVWIRRGHLPMKAKDTPSPIAAPAATESTNMEPKYRIDIKRQSTSNTSIFCIDCPRGLQLCQRNVCTCSERERESRLKIDNTICLWRQTWHRHRVPHTKYTHSLRKYRTPDECNGSLVNYSISFGYTGRTLGMCHSV